MSDKIEKLPIGYATGSDTYGELCKPRGESRAQELMERAAQRIVILMGKGKEGDRMTKSVEPITDKRQVEELVFRNRLAETPKTVQFAFWYSRVKELREDKDRLEKGSNKRKAELIIPTINTQIEESEQILRELFNEIKMERRVISRESNNED